jgi:hypothetical protein
VVLYRVVNVLIGLLTLLVVEELGDVINVKIKKAGPVVTIVIFGNVGVQE